jgi:CBS domain-containing protein
MQLKDIMTQSPAAIGAENSVRDAVKKMQALNVGFLPVSEDNQPIGVITDRDIAVRAVAEDLDLHQTAVREVMSPAVECLSEEESLEEAARLMREKQIRRVLVKDDNGGVCGVVSLGDLAVHTGDHDLCAETLEEISQPAMPNR